MNMVQLLFIGIAIGMANVIPGVSGSTMAVVFNIYDRFVNAITLNIKKLIENRRFVIPVVGGMALGVLLFSKLITVLYENFPVQTDYFFTGLIIGSIPMLFSFMTKKQDGQKFTAKKTISVVICALAGFAVLIGFGLLGSDVDTAKEISKSLPQWTFPLALHIFAAVVVPTGMWRDRSPTANRNTSKKAAEPPGGASTSTRKNEKKIFCSSFPHRPTAGSMRQ